jgi:hypothetical protein
MMSIKQKDIRLFGIGPLATYLGASQVRKIETFKRINLMTAEYRTVKNLSAGELLDGRLARPMATTTKPDPIRKLRDLAANFARAIDRTALDYEDVVTADLTERVACRFALDNFDQANPELVETPSAELRQRLNLLRQVVKANQDADWNVTQLSNHALKKRVELLPRVTATEAAIKEAKEKSAEDLASLDDDALELLAKRVAQADKARKRAKKKATPQVFRAVENFDADEGDEEAA